MTDEFIPPFNQQLLGNKWSEFDADHLSDGLYALSEALYKNNPDNQVHGLLGGAYGYGQDFKNSVFEMHPYFWGKCECVGDDHDLDCGEVLPNFRHFDTGLEVYWYKYIGRGMSTNREVDRLEFQSILTSCLHSIGGASDGG